MIDLFVTNPLATWLIIAALLLCAELATGSGWLLWPSASAAAVGVLTLTGWSIGGPTLVIVFAVLTIVTTLLARRLVPEGPLRPGPDINDRGGDLVGKRGKVTEAFNGGVGRVLVDGADWIAEADDPTPAVGSTVEVVRVLGGAKIAVRAVDA